MLVALRALAELGDTQQGPAYELPHGRAQVFELQPAYEGDVAGAAAVLVGNLNDVRVAIARMARSALKAPDEALATGVAGAAESALFECQDQPPE